MAADLIEPLERLRNDLRSVRLELDVPGADARRGRDDLVAQVDDYLLPRLRQLDAPALIVVGGSTGAGKSTLVNSLVGSIVSPAGVLRPTTRSPVLACHLDDVPRFEGDRVLPGLARVTGGAGAAGTLQLVATPALPPGSRCSTRRTSTRCWRRTGRSRTNCSQPRTAGSSSRPPPATRMPFPGSSCARPASGTVLSIVLNRVPADATGEVPAHLRQMLEAEQLADAEILVVPEVPLEGERIGATLSGPCARGSTGSQRTRRPATHSCAGRCAAPSRACRCARSSSSGRRWSSLRRRPSFARRPTSPTPRRCGRSSALRSGSLLRGEVLARWHEVVGTGDVMRALETRVGWLRDRLKSIVTGAPAADAELKVAVEHRIEAVVRTAAERAAERTARAWRERVPGRALLLEDTGLERATNELAAAAEDEGLAGRRLRARQRRGCVEALDGAAGVARRQRRRPDGDAGGLRAHRRAHRRRGHRRRRTSAVGQKVLEAIFGDQAVRTLASRAREDLLERVDRLLRTEANRFHALLDEAVPEADSFARLHGAVDAIRRAA